MRQSTESTFLHCLVELIVARQGRRLQRQLAGFAKQALDTNPMFDLGFAGC